MHEISRTTIRDLAIWLKFHLGSCHISQDIMNSVLFRVLAPLEATLQELLVGRAALSRGTREHLLVDMLAIVQQGEKDQDLGILVGILEEVDGGLVHKQLMVGICKGI